MKTVKINLTEVAIPTIDGGTLELPFGHISKGIGDMLYMQSETIDQEDLARKIHAGIDTEVNEDDLNRTLLLIDTRPPFAPLVNRKIKEYLNQKLETLKTQ